MLPSQNADLVSETCNNLENKDSHDPLRQEYFEQFS